MVHLRQRGPEYSDQRASVYGGPREGEKGRGGQRRLTEVVPVHLTHLVLVSHPEMVEQLIEDAAAASTAAVSSIPQWQNTRG